MVRLFGKKKGKQIELVVHGMTCEHCEMRVKKALMGVEGVQDAEASHAQEQAIVTVDPKVDVSLDALVAAVEAAGYQAEPPSE
jgi:Cu+-exporting ATPase